MLYEYKVYTFMASQNFIKSAGILPFTFLAIAKRSEIISIYSDKLLLNFQAPIAKLSWI